MGHALATTIRLLEYKILLRGGGGGGGHRIEERNLTKDYVHKVAINMSFISDELLGGTEMSYVTWF